MMPVGVEAADQPEGSATSARPRVVVRADLRPAAYVVLVVAALGLPLGLLWAWLAPPEIAMMVVDPGTGEVGVLPLPGQSEHRFDGMAIFVLLGLVMGALTGAALWLIRRWRGPMVLIAGVLGALAGAWVAMRTGLWLGEWRYPQPVDPQPGDVLVRTPVLESAWVIVGQPFGVAVAYSFAVAWNSADDLGRGRS